MTRLRFSGLKRSAVRWALDPSPLRTASMNGIRRWELGSYEFRVGLGAVDRPHYAYAVWHAARLAQRLGLPRISIIEFGVAGGNGLLSLEQHAAASSGASGVAIDVYGFDSGQGLPAPLDFRDLPYHWKPGFFGMDQAELRGRLAPIAGPHPHRISRRRPGSPARLSHRPRPADPGSSRTFSSASSELPLAAGLPLLGPSNGLKNLLNPDVDGRHRRVRTNRKRDPAFTQLTRVSPILDNSYGISQDSTVRPPGGGERIAAGADINQRQELTYDAETVARPPLTAGRRSTCGGVGDGDQFRQSRPCRPERQQRER